MAKFNTGEILVCINNRGFESQLTIGKEYSCLNWAWCDSTVLVRDDLGRKTRFGDTNFKKL